MLKRIITAIVGIAVLLPFLVFSHTWAIVVMTSIMSVIAVIEVLKCTGQLKRKTVTVLSVLVCLAAQILARILEGDAYTGTMLLVYIAYTVVFLTSTVFSRGEFSIGESTRNIVMTMYVSFGFSSLILLRDVEGSGMILCVLAFVIPWVCDAAAYFVGVFFGKHYLIPEVSPKKTVEGAIGGIVGVVAITAVFGFVMQFGFDRTPNYPVLLLLAFVGGLVSQWGDLIASLLKREHGVKDYGRLFPGHGGVMDRFDSLIPVAIFMYIVCRIFSGITVI